MKRSEINLFIAEAIDFFEANHFPLPPFASWTPDIWRQRGREADGIRECQLGWDVTDFNSGSFASCGLTLFTLRNGGDHHQSYAEKIMMVREHQVTPLHCHHRKTEDIINRGCAGSAGDLIVQLYESTSSGGLADSAFTVVCDGILRYTKPADLIRLGAGESITLPPRVYHTFHAVNGDALIGEVSSINNDVDDNHFYLPIPRFPVIVEDEPPFRLLCTEYSRLNMPPVRNPCSN